MTEAQLQIAVAEYLATKYPNVLFHSDFGSGVKLTARQAAVQSRQNAGRRGWPDIFIAQPIVSYGGVIRYPGLFLELKADGVRLRKKDGSWANPHIAGQAETLLKLQVNDYCAVFAVGFDQATTAIDMYLEDSIYLYYLRYRQSFALDGWYMGCKGGGQP